MSIVDVGALLAGANTGASTGAMSMDFDGISALNKALTADYGTDMATLQGGGALRVQSLDKVMQAVIQENSHFKLFNKLAKPKVGATVDEWTEQSGVGGFLGGSTNTETGAIAAATGQYNRRVGQVKYLMARREISFVLKIQNGIEDAEAVERANGALQLLTDAEYLSFEGDSSVVPTEFDGIEAQIRAGVVTGDVPGQNIIDMRAQPFNGVAPVNAAAATVRAFGSWGQLTDIFFSPQVQADFDNSLVPAYRVALSNSPNSIELGTPVIGIRATGGAIMTQEDTFIREDGLKTPFELRYPATASAQIALKPTAVAGTPAGNASSMFAAGQAGNYYYAVAGMNAAGTSPALVSAQVAVAAGQGVSLAISASASGLESGYVIYRSRLNGTNAIGDLREMCRVPRTGATTTFVDLNTRIPGTTKAYGLDMRPGQTAIMWKQMLPMMKFDLYPTVSATVPWAQLLFGYLRISKRKHMVVFDNILPTGASWRPFN